MWCVSVLREATVEIGGQLEVHVFGIFCLSISDVAASPLEIDG